MDLVVERLKEMNIKLGEDIGEPIALMCYHKSIIWSGVIKLHSKTSLKDGINLIQGLRPFNLKIEDDKFERGKICWTYDSLALNNLLSVKITSERLEYKEWHEMYEKSVEERFKRWVEYEITNIQKKKDNNLCMGNSILPRTYQKNQRKQDHIRQ